MTAVGTNFVVDVHMELTPSPIHMRPTEPDPLSVDAIPSYFPKDTQNWTT